MILLETILHSFANLAILLFEYICVGILIFSGIQGILNCLRAESSVRLTLGRGIATALEFLLGSAVLRTLTDPALNTALTALVILAVLAGLSILIHLAEKTAAHTVDDKQLCTENKSVSDTSESVANEARESE